MFMHINHQRTKCGGSDMKKQNNNNNNRVRIIKSSKIRIYSLCLFQRKYIFIYSHVTISVFLLKKKRRISR